jgi:transcription antitermination factor NusA-like protein
LTEKAILAIVPVTSFQPSAKGINVKLASRLVGWKIPSNKKTRHE